MDSAKAGHGYDVVHRCIYVRAAGAFCDIECIVNANLLSRDCKRVNASLESGLNMAKCIYMVMD